MYWSRAVCAIKYFLFGKCSTSYVYKCIKIKNLGLKIYSHHKTGTEFNFKIILNSFCKNFKNANNILLL